MEAGVYLISNNVNGKCYVGSTIHLNRRRLEHFSALANCKHVNAHLQNAYITNMVGKYLILKFWK